MKFTFRILVLALGLWGASLGSGVAEEQTLRLATDPWPPYSIGFSGGKLQGGYALEVGTALSRHLNCDFKADLFPWRRVLLYMEKGNYDITFPVQYKPDRERFMVFSDVVLEDRVFVWLLKDRQDDLVNWQTIDDLKPYKFGIVSGYTYQAQMDEALEKRIIRSEQSFSAEPNFIKLIGKRFDAVLESESVVLSFFKKNPEWRQQIIHAPTVVAKDEFRIGISKKSTFAKMLPQINQVIQKMKDDGTINRITGQ